MIKTICETEKCTGCMACYNACHQNAISFQQNEEGFLYPVIDSSKCIDCGLCTKVCPVNNPTKKQKPIKVYSGWSNDEETRINSSSGGAFTEIAKVILDRHGVVFGCALNEKLQAVHTWIDNIDDIKKIQGSKYVQSQINNSYKLAKEFLKQDRYVLFSGTPCQIAGLKNYLGKDYEKLITIDLICHGVPSPMIFEKYKEYIKEKYHFKNITKINFRCKKSSWIFYSMAIYGHTEKGKEKEYIGKYYNDAYIRGFLRDYFLRPNCHHCQYTSTNRVSDFTIADWWGYKKTSKEDKDFFTKGVSLIFANTGKSIKIIEIISMLLKERKLEEAKSTNISLSHPFVESEKRITFWADMKKKAFLEIIEKYMKPEVLKLPTKIKSNFKPNPVINLIIKTIIKFEKLKSK